MRRILLAAAAVFLALPLFPEKIAFSAASMTGQTGEKSTVTRLNGNAYILTESMEITADSIELSGDGYRYIKASGMVKGKNSEAGLDFVCSQMDYDRETKVAALRGDVDMTDVENGVRAKAQSVEYNQNTDIAVLQVEVNIVQKSNVCTGSFAVYNKKNQLLDLSGNAKIKQDSDVFRAQHITLDIDTQEISLDGNVRGSITDRKESRPETEKNDLPPDADGQPSGMAVPPEQDDSEIPDGADSAAPENHF